MLAGPIFSQPAYTCVTNVASSAAAAHCIGKYAQVTNNPENDGCIK